MCPSCAFRKTCETWGEPRNRLVSQICAAGPIPFYCHQGVPWGNPLAHALPPRSLAQLAGGKLRLCEGWKQAVASRQWPADGALRRYQRWLAIAALKAADRFHDGAATVRELQRELSPLAQFYRGPRAWQIARMVEKRQ